jgi:hypothetical protein
MQPTFTIQVSKDQLSALYEALQYRSKKLEQDANRAKGDSCKSDLKRSEILQNKRMVDGVIEHIYAEYYDFF